MPGVIPSSIGVLSLSLAAVAGQRYPMDAPIPPQPPISASIPTGPDALSAPIAPVGRDLGTPTTLFVNFDGVDLGECNPSNSKNNCHWYNNEEPIAPFSGTLQTKVSVLQAMRSDVSDFGIRITGIRPSDSEDYTMVVYGGVEADFGALGSAPAGDCLDQLPNQIAFAHVDGELNTWVNGGATTALHEAAHSWGLDHIENEGAIMFPSGDNGPTTFRRECSQVVQDVALTPGEGSCPELNASLCENNGLQDARSLLSMMFGPSYIDGTPPKVELVEPADGQYFQAPASFDVVLDVRDDLHPQTYTMRAWYNDQTPPSEGQPILEPGFAVNNLPIGTWTFQVAIADRSGNETQVDFVVEVGEDPPPDPDPGDPGCTCHSPRASTAGGVSSAGWLVVLLIGVARRRRATSTLPRS